MSREQAIADTLAVARAMLSWGHPLICSQIAAWGGLDARMVANRLRGGSEVAARISKQPAIFKRDMITKEWSLTSYGRHWVENVTTDNDNASG